MGISSPVTRGSAGGEFQKELARQVRPRHRCRRPALSTPWFCVCVRQLADFLTIPLRQRGGIMHMPEVYTLFNRARGTELVSPEDLLHVCKLWPSLGIVLRLKPFLSGVLAVHDASFDVEEVRHRAERNTLFFLTFAACRRFPRRLCRSSSVWPKDVLTESV